MKEIKNASAFARQQGVSRQLIDHRIKTGWKFGILDGVKVMYNPKFVHKVIEVTEDEKRST